MVLENTKPIVKDFLVINEEYLLKWSQRNMSKPYSPKIERKIIKRTIKQGLFDPVEAQADIDEQYERFLEEQERKALRKKRKNNQKNWDDDN